MKNGKLPRDTCDTRDRRRASVASVTSVTGETQFMANLKTTPSPAQDSLRPAHAISRKGKPARKSPSGAASWPWLLARGARKMEIQAGALKDSSTANGARWIEDIQFVTQANSAGVFAPPKRARVRVRESCRQIFAAGNSVLTEAK